MYHVLPHLAIEGAPGEWTATFRLLLYNGASVDDALKQIAFAYSGNPFGALPEELCSDRPEQRTGSPSGKTW